MTMNEDQFRETVKYLNGQLLRVQLALVGLSGTLMAVGESLDELANQLGKSEDTVVDLDHE